MKRGWQCPYCGGSNRADDRSCPGCGCMQQSIPKVVAYRQWQASRPTPYGVIRRSPTDYDICIGGLWNTTPRPPPPPLGNIGGADPTPIIGAILFVFILIYMGVGYFAVGF